MTETSKAEGTLNQLFGSLVAMKKKKRMIQCEVAEETDLFHHCPMLQLFYSLLMHYASGKRYFDYLYFYKPYKLYDINEKMSIPIKSCRCWRRAIFLFSYCSRAVSCKVAMVV